MNEIERAIAAAEDMKRGCHDEMTDQIRIWDTIIAALRAELSRQENAPQPEITICGYSVKHLEMIALLMRDHGVTPEDVKAAAMNYADGAMFAFKAATESIEKSVRETVQRIASPYTEGETK